MTNSLALKKCVNADISSLAKLSKKTFSDAFKSQNNPDDYALYVDTAFSEDTILKELENPNGYFYFIKIDNVVGGYIKINEGNAQTDLNDAHSLELGRIYILDIHQGKGIGEWIISQVIQMALEKKKEYIWLGVWEENRSAIRFYERHGFVKFGTHPYYIGTDKQTDWMMRLDIKQKVSLNE